MGRKRIHPSQGARDWYGKMFWRVRRKHQLRTEPLCKFCLARGIITPATVADHVEPHRNDFNKFTLGGLQSLCETCHNKTKRLIERRGYAIDVGADGYPTDPRHPAYNARDE